LLVAACWSLVALAEELIAIEDGVLVLTGDNFEAAIESNPQILVEFYAPWCGHCKKLAPEYSAAAEQLAEKGAQAKLAKVDATEHKELGQKFGVKGYPTLKFFKNGVAQDYTGGRTADTIVQWIQKKSGPDAQTLSSKEEADAFVADNKVSVIGFFKTLDGNEDEAFLEAAASSEDVVFGMTSSEEIFKAFEIDAEKAVIINKQFDEGRLLLSGEITAESISEFVIANSLPLVVDFNSDTAKQIFQGKIKNHFLMFQSAEDEKYEHNLHNARKVAKEMKGDMMFVTITTDEAEHKRVLDFFAITEDEVPTFRLSAGDDMVKFKPDNKELSEENIRAFIQSWKDGELKPHLKSDDVPEDWDAADVKVLVGKNFADVALDVEKDVFVEFYAPWCGHCKKLAPIWEELAEKFKDNEKIVIAKLDATTNEVEDVKIRGFPTLKLFKAGDNTVVDYSGGRTLEDFVKFLSPKEETEKDEL